MIQKLIITTLENREIEVEGNLKTLLMLKKQINAEPQIVDYGTKEFNQTDTAIKATYIYYD